MTELLMKRKCKYSIKNTRMKSRTCNLYIINRPFIYILNFDKDNKLKDIRLKLKNISYILKEN